MDSSRRGVILFMVGVLFSVALVSCSSDDLSSEDVIKVHNVRLGKTHFYVIAGNEADVYRPIDSLFAVGPAFIGHKSPDEKRGAIAAYLADLRQYGEGGEFRHITFTTCGKQVVTFYDSQGRQRGNSLQFEKGG